MMCVEYMVNIGQSYGDPPYFHVKLIKVIHNNSYFLNTLYIYIYNQVSCCKAWKDYSFRIF